MDLNKVRIALITARTLACNRPTLDRERQTIDDAITEIEQGKAVTPVPPYPFEITTTLASPVGTGVRFKCEDCSTDMVVIQVTEGHKDGRVDIFDRSRGLLDFEMECPMCSAIMMAEK